MSELLIVNPIALLVHPGISRKNPGRYPESEEDEAKRMGKTLRWARQVAENPTSAMIHISAFWDRHRGILKPDMSNEAAFWENQACMEELEASYGPRLITFGTWENPTLKQITTGLRNCGLRVDPKITHLEAAGEFLEECVPALLKYITDTLNLPQTPKPLEEFCARKYTSPIRTSYETARFLRILQQRLVA